MADIDHRFVAPPYLRATKTIKGGAGDTVTVWDLRIAQPNVSHLGMRSIHSLEHFMGTLLPDALSAIVNVGPMGCQTGFYITTLNLEEYDVLEQCLAQALEDVGKATEVPLANNVQCGWAENHTLVGAQNVASWLLLLRKQWARPLIDRVASL